MYRLRQKIESDPFDPKILITQPGGCGAEIIARHPRSHDREDMVFDPIH